MQKLITAFKNFLGINTKPPNPVQWKFSTKKVSLNTYSIHITALIAHPWRLYSQKSSLEGPLPTKIRFEENSYIIVLGDIKEVGKLKEDYHHFYKSITHFYTSVVDFVQEVTAFAKPETLKGKIIYMVGTDKRCLNPKEITFQIELN